MKSHVHIGALEVGQFMLMLVIAGFIFRSIEIKYPESPMGKALAFIY